MTGPTPCPAPRQPGPFGEFYGTPNAAGNRPVRLNAAGQAAVTEYLADPKRRDEPAGICRANRKASASYAYLSADPDRRDEANEVAVLAILEAFRWFDPARMKPNKDGTPGGAEPYVTPYVTGAVIELAQRYAREPKAVGGDARSDDRLAADPVADAAEPDRYAPDPDAPDAARMVRECLPDPLDVNLVLACFKLPGAPGFGSACQACGLSRAEGEERVRVLMAMLNIEYATV